MDYEFLLKNSGDMVAKAAAKLAIARINANIATCKANIALMEMKELEAIVATKELDLQTIGSHSAKIREYKQQLKGLQELRRKLFPKPNTQISRSTIEDFGHPDV